MNKKAYLCNGNMKRCKKTGCYINGGERRRERIGGKGMDDLEKFIEDCKEYKKVMRRMGVLGAKNDAEAVILLNRECDEYREKIRSLEEAMCELSDPVFIPSPEEKTCSECIADLPEDILKKVHTVRIEPDGAVTMYLNEE